MTDAAAPSAFSATFADWKLIKTRGCVQIVLEVPLHQADHAYQVLGGMPDPSKERWVGVARLAGATREREAEGATVPPAPASSASRSQQKKRWEDMPPSQQAGILCGERSFWAFLSETYPVLWKTYLNKHQIYADAAAEFVRETICGVNSRSEIITGTQTADKWSALVSDYRAWQRYPEVVG